MDRERKTVRDVDVAFVARRDPTPSAHAAFARNIDPTDALSDSQRRYAEAQFALFQSWYAAWSRRPEVVALQG